MLKDRVKSLIPRHLIQALHPLLMKRSACKNGLSLHLNGAVLEISKDNRMIRISRQHTVYLNDIFASFDYYHGAVKPFKVNGVDIVDYASPRYHDVMGFDVWPIMLPSFAEPVITASQYLAFARLSAGKTVIDLGAYSGLTSMIFSQAVGPQGCVIAVDADPTNLQCIHRNIDRFNKHFASSIHVIEGAIWNNSNGIEFSGEGNMGASASMIVGKNRGPTVKVQTFTLSDVAHMTGLTSVDFIKCDVEGAEAVVFEDKNFFDRFRPRIIIEPHRVDGRLTSDKVIADLSSYGYTCKSILQEGVTLPLLECVP